MPTTTAPLVRVIRSRVLLRPRRRPGERRCAYCHAGVGEEVFTCDDCSTQLHLECRDLLHECPTLGCASAWPKTVGTSIDPSPPRGLGCAACDGHFEGADRRRRACVRCGAQYHWRCRFQLQRCSCGSHAFRAVRAPLLPRLRLPRFRLPRIPDRVRRVVTTAFMQAWVGVICTTLVVLLYGFGDWEPTAPQAFASDPGYRTNLELVALVRDLQHNRHDPTARAALKAEGPRGLRALVNELADRPWRERAILFPFAEELAAHSQIRDPQLHDHYGRLWQARNRDLPAVVLALDDGQADVRVHAKRALRDAGPRVLPHLIRRLERTDDLSLDHAFADQGAEAIPPLRASLVERGTVSAADVLARFGPPAVSALCDGLVNAPTPEARRASAQGLWSLGRDAEEALPALIEALDADPSRDVRLTARHAIQRIEGELYSAVPWTEDWDN